MATKTGKANATITGNPDKRLPFNKMTSLDLMTGFEEDGLIVLPIVPKMKTITHEGKTYHRMDCWQVMPDGSQRATYLWDGYGKEMLRRKRESEATT